MSSRLTVMPSLASRVPMTAPRPWAPPVMIALDTLYLADTCLLPDFLSRKSGRRCAPAGRGALRIVPRPAGRLGERLLTEHVRSGRITQRGVRLAAQRRRRDLLAGPLGDPGGPVLPPGDRLHRRRRQPLVRVLREFGQVSGPMLGLGVGRVDDPGDVSGVGQDESHVAGGEQGALVRAAPGCDVILL